MSNGEGFLSTGAEAHATPEIDVYQAVDESMPLLQFLRDKRRIGSMIMPPDHPRLPNESVLLMPYYKNRTDPVDLGTWHASIGTLRARISTQLTGRGLYAKVTTMDSGSPREVNAAEGRRVADALLSVRDVWEQQMGRKVSDPQRRPIAYAVEKALNLHVGQQSS